MKCSFKEMETNPVIINFLCFYVEWGDSICMKTWFMALFMEEYSKK